MAILTYAWQRLTPGGRLVASAVTETNKYALMQFADTLAVSKREFMQINVSQQAELANLEVLRPKLPVTLIAWDKPEESLKR